MGSLDVFSWRAELLNVIPFAAEFRLIEGSALACRGKGTEAKDGVVLCARRGVGRFTFFPTEVLNGAPSACPLVSIRLDVWRCSVISGDLCFGGKVQNVLCHCFSAFTTLSICGIRWFLLDIPVPSVLGWLQLMFYHSYLFGIIINA